MNDEFLFDFLELFNYITNETRSCEASRDATSSACHRFWRFPINSKAIHPPKLPSFPVLHHLVSVLTNNVLRWFAEGRKDKRDIATFAGAISDLISNLQVLSAFHLQDVYWLVLKSELTLYKFWGHYPKLWVIGEQFVWNFRFGIHPEVWVISGMG